MALGGKVALPQGKRACTHFTGGRVGFYASLDGCGKSHRKVDTVGIRFIGYAIPAPIIKGGYSSSVSFCSIDYS
jgi:hypothetical protein